jgi:diguanylate cyclase (GGDEF)-like protein
MDTRTLVILLVAINIVIATVAVLIPWIRARRERMAVPAATATRPGTAGNGSSGGNGSAAHPPSALAAATATGSGPSGAASAPWVPERAAGPGRADGTEPAAPQGPPLDATTGLDLPGAWARWLTEEDARVQRFHRPATIVLVELAGLDRLADRLGDDAAGRLIPPIATTLRRDARATDHLARLGETRFAALLPETTEVQAIHYVERVRSACDVWLEAGAVALRLSIGWAEVNPTRHANLALLDAERRLFAEREKARGQLARADDEPPAEIPVLQPSAAPRSAQA